ncbi:MAG: uroporphyrinogen-III C-methyltransferase [Burkholderiales bacterium]
MSEISPEQPQPETAPQPAAGASAAPVYAALAVVIALAALAFAAWQWHDGRNQMNALRQELAKKLADADSRAGESRLIAAQVREAVSEAQVKIGVLENKLAESQSQQIALEALYQELSRNRDEWAFAEIEQSLQLASQQLQLAGNVKGALIALANADLRLQRMERPQLAPLRKAVNRDIERLKALPHVDIVGISVRLDNIVAAIDTLPLAMEARPAPSPAAAETAPAPAPAWRRFVREAWDEARQLMRIQRMDKPDVPLLAPPQNFFLRENLKLRLLGARLALLTRDETSYRADLKAAREWLARYYDSHDPAVAATLAALQTLHDGAISLEVVDISATLEALRNYRAMLRERPGR